MSKIDKEQSIRLVTSSRKKKEWMRWEEKLLAIRQIKGFSDIFDLKPEDIPKDSDDLDDDTIVENEAKREICENNRKAYHILVLSMSRETPHCTVAFTIVRSTKSAEYPSGNAALAFQRLKKRYCPSTAPALAILHQKFFASKLKNRMGEMRYAMEDDQIFLHVLNNLTPKYDQQVFATETRIVTQDADKKMKIEEVEDAICLRYECINKGCNDDEYGKEIALFAGGKFKCKCNKCG
jgi:hypothetical protein